MIKKSSIFAMLISFSLMGVVTFESAAQAQSPAPARKENPFRPLGRHLIYVTLPGTLEGDSFRNGIGIVVLNADDNYSFVKRIPTWDVAASKSAEQLAGVTASPTTNLIYLAARGRLGAIDLETDKMVWSNTYDGHCCERPQVTADGKILIVGSDLGDFWYKIDAKTGKLISKIEAPKSPNAHNLNLSPDNKLAFMSPNGPILSVGDIQSSKTIKTITFGDNVRPFVVNHDGSLIYSNTNNLLGFEVADVASGKIIKHVEVNGFGWPGNWDKKNPPRVPHGCPSHGIMLTPDEKEVWIVDGISNYIHIFDNTKSTPVHVDSIKVNAGPFWLMVGLDGKYVFSSSGDVIDLKTRKIVNQLKDEFGRVMYSEKLLDMMFFDGKLERVANQFGNGGLQSPAGYSIGLPK